MAQTRQGTPFPFEGPVPADLLIDRRDELGVLARRAADRVSVRLVAPRRFGKTSLLLAHAGVLQASGWRAVHVDFSRVADLTDVARRIAAAYSHLDASWVRSHLGGLLARMGLTLTASGPGLTVGPRPYRAEPEAAETLALQLLDLPKTLFDRDGQATLVVFDEFQDLLVARKDLDGLLRSRLQYHGDAAAYVYAGSEPSMMRTLFDVRERPLFGQADPLPLGPLPVDAALGELHDRFAAEGLAPGDALSELIVFAAGHPQRSMWLAYLLADALADGREPTPALAAELLSHAVQVTEPGHQAVWQQLGTTERVVLAAVADGTGPTSHALASDHGVARTTLQGAADRLADRGHLVRDGQGSRVVDPVLAEWLRRR